MKRPTKTRRVVKFNTGTRVHRPKKGAGSYIRKKKNDGSKK
jgi:stalled ribosome alternative rescue factor ArfA